jgi:hypothetical protein
MAPPAVLANAPMPAAFVNYRDKYRTENDVCNGQYLALLATQDPESPVQPAAMLQTVLAFHDDLPKVFLVMIPGERVGDAIRIRTLHSLSVYRPSFAETTPWDSIPFAFDSDVFPGSGASISTVEFPATAFHRTANVQVPNEASMDAKWIEADAGGPPVDLLGPYENTEADKDTTRAIRNTRAA